MSLLILLRLESENCTFSKRRWHRPPQVHQPVLVNRDLENEILHTNVRTMKDYDNYLTVCVTKIKKQKFYSFKIPLTLLLSLIFIIRLRFGTSKII